MEMGSSCVVISNLCDSVICRTAWDVLKTGFGVVRLLVAVNDAWTPDAPSQPSARTSCTIPFSILPTAEGGMHLFLWSVIIACCLLLTYNYALTFMCLPNQLTCCDKSKIKSTINYISLKNIYIYKNALSCRRWISVRAKDRSFMTVLDDAAEASQWPWCQPYVWGIVLHVVFTLFPPNFSDDFYSMAFVSLSDQHIRSV